MTTEERSEEKSGPALAEVFMHDLGHNDGAAEAHAQYRPARQGVYQYWQHACGYVEAWGNADAPESDLDGEGCDACESSPGGWRRLYVRDEPAPAEDLRSPPADELVNTEPRWKPPTILATCPSCGRRAELQPGTWAYMDGTLQARLLCGDSEDCSRIWDLHIREPAPASEIPVATLPEDHSCESCEAALTTPALAAEVERLQRNLAEVRAAKNLLSGALDQAHAIRHKTEARLVARANEAEHERDAMRPVVEAAEALTDAWATFNVGDGKRLSDAVTTYRALATYDTKETQP